VTNRLGDFEVWTENPRVGGLIPPLWCVAPHHPLGIPTRELL
jgi:hypothetical protein